MAILPEPRQGREVFQVLVHHREDAGAAPSTTPATDLLRLIGGVGERARSAGLDSDTLARRMGHALGEAVAQKGSGAGLARREALAQLGPMVQGCGLGTVSIVSVTPLVLRVQGPPAGGSAGARRCTHVAGFLEGSLGTLLGQPVRIKEVDCVCIGNSYCTFSCEL